MDPKMANIDFHAKKRSKHAKKGATLAPPFVHLSMNKTPYIEDGYASLTTFGQNMVLKNPFFLIDKPFLNHA
jgi:hypothetical protein